MLKSRKGFTLVELVIVIAIIGILAGIAIPYYTDATATARGAKIVADMATIQEAYTMYLAKNGGEQKDIIIGSRDEYPEIIPMLVKQGYLEAIPVPPVGKAIFVNADDAYREFKVFTGATYTFINHGDVSMLDVLVALDPGWGDPQPISRFTHKY
ncbi:prepilin-type N-terminal cleavage/methylation domain-containing protein [Phascolarctobacterium sp.]